MPVAAPLISTAVGAVGSLLGRKSANKAAQPSGAELAAEQGQTQNARNLTGTGTGLLAQGMPQLRQAGGYFSTLAGGNRAALTQALAPDIENINAVYGGTARTLQRFTRGPERTVQMAEAERERAGQVASLFRNARPQANAQLANMGQETIRGAGSLFDSAAGQYGNQAGRGLTNRYAGENLKRQAGEDYGNLFFNLAQTGMGLFRPGGGGGPLPSRSTVGNVGFLPGG